MINIIYPQVLDIIQAYSTDDRTDSHAFLAWFLIHFYRLDETNAYDAICDGYDDKGVDGIYVDHNLEQVDIIQSKLFQNPSKTIGDNLLKNLAGTVDQFRDPKVIENIEESTSNPELSGLINSENLASLVNKGYDVRGVFVTNAESDDNTTSYVKNRNDIEIFDRCRLTDTYVPAGPSTPVAAPISFDVSEYDVIQYHTPEAFAIVAPLKASQLVELSGIESGELFNWNVRQSLGRTKVNKAIAKTVKNQGDHKNFILFHNGLTILAGKLGYGNDLLEIEDYTVVNGCQSLTSLYDNRRNISDELRVLARIIELPPESDLATKITQNSNNQNAISARDLQSNSSIQRRLQNEFNTKYGNRYFYEIKRGESVSDRELITNEEAARVLLAFDLLEPWTCHQSYKLFDQLHSAIFGRPEVTAERIVALWMLYEVIIDRLTELKNETMSKYKLTRYLLLYLTRKALETDALGREFCANPASFVDSEEKVERLTSVVSTIVSDLIVDLNAELDERDSGDTYFDYKRELKSPNSIRQLTQQIIPMYEKAVKRKRATGFADEWNTC